VISIVSDEATLKTLPSYCLSLPPFTANSGMNTDIENTDVMPIVKIFIKNDFPEYVHDQTNFYASQIIKAATCPFTKHSLFRTCTPVTVPELKKFFGLMFVSGTTDMSNLKLHWAEDPVFGTSIFSKTMALNHFESTLSSLHVSDSNMHETSTDRLYKIRSILERLSEIFSMVYISKHWLAQ
jgi:hypothetical protein